MVANLANLMTPKQREVWHSYLNDDWKYLINSGAVRAGKTYIDNIIFLAEIRRVKEMAAKRYDKQPKYILAGFSSNSIYDNVISELYTTFGLNIPLIGMAIITCLVLKLFQPTRVPNVVSVRFVV